MLLHRRASQSVRIVACFILAILFALSVVSGNSHAQSTANTLKVSPVRTDIQIKAGSRDVVEITITNLTNKPVLVAPIENDFIQGDESGTPSIILDEKQYAPTHSLKRFMAPIANVTVPAKESVTVGVTISVPADAQAGGYFGALRFAPTNPDGGGQVNLSPSVASLILLTVPGPTTEKLNLTEFTLQQGSKPGTDFRTPKDLKAVFRFENKGNVQLGPFGKISVTQGDTLVYDYDFNNKNPRDVVLPDGARKWEIPLNNIGDFGYYTVHGTFTYGTKNQTIEVERSFWIIPTSYIIAAIAAIIVIIGLVIGLVFWLRGRRRRAIRRRAGRRR